MPARRLFIKRHSQYAIDPAEPRAAPVEPPEVAKLAVVDIAALEEAFVSYLEEAAGASTSGTRQAKRLPEAPGGGQSIGVVHTHRLLACSIHEALKLWRDPIRLGFALFGTAFLRPERDQRTLQFP